MVFNTDTIYFNTLSGLTQRLADAQYSSVYLFCDENTRRDCLPIFYEMVGHVENAVFVMPPGESNKNLDTCQLVWADLLEHGADRHSLLINLGGGVVCDLGAFCAATYMRGIDTIQIPTSLLAQVDASVGGKNGVDFHHYKNMIGTFAQPKAVYIESAFLKTLPQREYQSGMVEMYKHALLSDEATWHRYEHFTQHDLGCLIEESVAIKQNIVAADPLESDLRKALNLGHTVGHAIEHLALSRNIDIRHGEAIAFGILVAIELSVRLLQFDRDVQARIFNILLPHCTFIPHEDDKDEILNLIKADKKNRGNEIRFTLLKRIGEPRVDQIMDEPTLQSALTDCIINSNKKHIAPTAFEN